MPRRMKRRNCRTIEGERCFKPTGIPRMELKTVHLNMDEFEAIRLCDYDGLSQIEAGESLGVSRGTVQRLLISARKKLVDILLHNKELVLNNRVEEE